MTNPEFSKKTDKNGQERISSISLLSNPEELLEEADTLATYVARHGDVLIQADAVKSSGASNLRENSYQQLLSAISSVSQEPKAANFESLMKAYADVTTFTYADRGVNGRTILDTNGQTSKKKNPRHRRKFSARRRPLIIGLILFAGVLFLEFASTWTAKVSDPLVLEGAKFQAFEVIVVLSPFLIPAFWGGIGSCIFLMKRLTDRLAELAYEESRVRGDGTRIFLGAMLGVIIVVLFFPDFDKSLQIGDVKFGPAMAAFLGGLGVKPVYAAFEALSEELAQRVSGKGGKK